MSRETPNERAVEEAGWEFLAALKDSGIIDSRGMIAHGDLFNRCKPMVRRAIECYLKNCGKKAPE